MTEHIFDSDAERLVARSAVVDAVVQYATGVDRRDWALYAACFTDPCTFDFSSFNGRPPTEFGPVEWARNVARTNGNFDATQHLSTNHVVSFDSATSARCVSEMQAQHWFSEERMEQLGHTGEVGWCTLGGHYTNDLTLTNDGWKISRCRLEVRWTTGNPLVFGIARLIGDGGR